MNRRQIGRVIRSVCDAEGCTFDASVDRRLFDDLRRSDAVEVEYQAKADADVRSSVDTKGLWSLLDQVRAATHR